MTPPTSIDGTDITGATIDGQDVQEITVDGQTVFAAVDISDSAVYRFKLDEGSGTSISDSIGGLTGTLSSDFWVSGDFQGGFALDGDATDNEVTVSDAIPALTNGLTSGWAVALTIDNETEFFSRIMFAFDGTRLIRLEGNGRFEFRDDSGTRAQIEPGTDASDGAKRRFLINGASGDPANWQYFYNATPETTNIRSGGVMADFEVSSNLFLLSRDGNDFSDAIIDDIIIYNRQLTNDEIQADFDAQPWT